MGEGVHEIVISTTLKEKSLSLKQISHFVPQARNDRGKLIMKIVVDHGVERPGNVDRE